MSDPENFVARWSRLKRETVQKTKEIETKETDAAQPNAQPEAKVEPKREAPAAAPEAGQPSEHAFDLASLPPIESITATSDIRAFLHSGVPAELTKAALRRVWTSDPAIRDFIGLAENQWDFTDPTAMPGFGPLEAADNVSELVAQALGKLGGPPQPGEGPGPDAPDIATATSSASTSDDLPTLPQVLGIPAGNEAGAESAVAVEEQKNIVSVALQHDEGSEKDQRLPNRRPHGRALPR
jgi:hypothetical protein